MKIILYILEDGRFGGMNKMTTDIAKHVSQRGFHTHLLVGEKDSRFFTSYLEAQKVSYTLVAQRILSKKILDLVRYAVTFLPDILRLVQHINRINPDLVYCNASQQIKGVLAAKLTGKRIVWHMHDTFQPPLLIFLFKMVKSLCRVRYFVASSERTMQFYGLDTRYTHISRPPIDTSFFYPTASQPARLSSNPVKILTVSNINTDKGIDTLVRVAAELNKQKVRFHFTVVGLIPSGRSGLYHEITQLMQELHVENIEFLGQKDDIRLLLSETDLYLCTSRNESGPISVFEALAMEIPVITTDVGDLKQLFSKYHYGSVFPVDDHLALATEILHIMNNPEKMTARTKVGRRVAKDELDIYGCVAGQVEMYRRLLSNKSIK